MFRDETHSTEKKVEAREAWSVAAPRNAMELGWNIRARYAFFSIYVFSFSQSCDAVAPFYRRASTSNPLATSVEATSLAFLAVQLNNPGLIRLARESYVTAIQSLSRALMGPHTSGGEETLQAILLLDMYEKMVIADPRNPASWMSHLQGGCALLLTRCKNILSSLTGHQLAVRLATLLTASCAAAAVPVPDGLGDLRRNLGIVAGDPKWTFISLMGHTAGLQADFHRTGCSLDVASRAKRLDYRLKNLQMTLPPRWKPHRVFSAEEDQRVFACYYDVYLDHYITQVSNGIRSMRLILIDIIRKHASDEFPGLHSSMLRDIQDITREICASVPQFTLPEARPGNAEPFPPRQRLQCCALLAPLYLASKVSDNNRMRSWVD
ncbi:MAG: hypothetical protein ACRERD_14580, partial [Candidatus Binatia bacterium]